MEDIRPDRDRGVTVDRLLNTLMVQTGGKAVVDVHGVASILGISLRHVYELMRRRQDPLPYVQAGRVRRVPLVLLAAWMLAEPLPPYSQAA